MKTDEAYTYAWEHADRNPDGSRVETSMETGLWKDAPADEPATADDDTDGAR